MSDSLDPLDPAWGDDFPGSLRESWIAAGLWFVFALILLVILRSRVWALTGHDAYYHMRFAAHFLENGVGTHVLPWLRMSVMADQWGDKEFLFRMFLLPFAAMDDLLVGGKMALCVLNALQAAVVAFVGVRWGGRRGALLPLLVLGVSMQVWYRLDLLRPHNLSVILLICAAYLIGRRSYRLLGLLGVVYALSYTACQTLWILCAGTFVLLWFERREREWRLLLYPALGLCAGLVLHPEFPLNVLIWKLNNIDIYTHKDVLAIGLEARPGNTQNLLIQSGMALFLVGVGVLTTRPWGGAARPGRQEVILFGFAFAFVLLYCFAYRFIEYAAAFSALYLYTLYNRLSANPTHAADVRRPRNILMALLVIYAVLFNGVFLRAAGSLQGENPYFFESPEELEAFAAAIPVGAHVAAPWDVTSMYCFAAPHGRYLSQLDPVFMFAKNPALYPVAERLFKGHCNDVAAVAQGMLDSQYIALPRLDSSARLRHQMERDPRTTLVHDGERHVVYRIEPVDGFVTDWEFTMEEDPTDAAFSGLSWPWDLSRTWVSPRPFSDLSSVLEDDDTELQTWWARRTITLSEDAGEDHRVRFSARGRAEILVDGESVMVCQGVGVLAPGQVEFPLPLVPGRTHRIDVRITSDGVPGGFFWQDVVEPVATPEAPR